jgi:hypothetical protein
VSTALERFEPADGRPRCPRLATRTTPESHQAVTWCGRRIAVGPARFATANSAFRGCRVSSSCSSRVCMVCAVRDSAPKSPASACYQLTVRHASRACVPLNAQAAACREPGWAGVARLRDLTTVARQYAQELLVFQGDTQLRALHTSHRLHAVQSLSATDGTAPAAPLVAAAEGHAVSLWDFRAADACVARMPLQDPGSCIYALAAGPGGTIAAGGTFQGLAVWDLRSQALLQSASSGQSNITFVGFLGPELERCCTGSLSQAVVCAPLGIAKVRHQRHRHRESEGRAAQT